MTLIPQPTDTSAVGMVEHCLGYLPQISLWSQGGGDPAAVRMFNTQFVGCSSKTPCHEPTCGASYMSADLKLFYETDAVTTDRMIDAAGQLLLKYRNLKLPQQTTADEDSVRTAAADALTRLGHTNPIKVVENLARAIELGETESLTVGACLRGIEKHLSMNVTADVRNRAVAAVGQVAAAGSPVYGQFAPTTARRIYTNIKKYLGKPEPAEFCVTTPPTPMGTLVDVIQLQKILNVVGPHYGLLQKLTPTGRVDDTTLMMVATLASRFTASALASPVYVEIMKCPTASTVEAHSKVLTADLTGLAKQLKLGKVFPWKSVALATVAISSAIFAGYVGLRRWGQS